MNSRIFIAAVAGAAVALGVAIGVSAWTGHDPDGIPKSDEVQTRVMSPFCPGLLLADCPSSQAAELRDAIDKRLSEGWTNERIDAWLIANYGEKVLARPRDTQAWLPPLIWASGGGLLTGLAVVKWGSRSAAGEDLATPAISDEDRERLSLELGEFEDGGTE